MPVDGPPPGGRRCGKNAHEDHIEDFPENREIFLVDGTGKPLECWAGKYALDPTHPKARRRIRRDLRTTVEDWGYDYVKIDGLELGGDPVNNYYMDTFYEKEKVRRRFQRNPAAGPPVL